MQSGLRHLNTLSSGGGIDAKWQNGHDTKPSTPAAITSASCRLQRRMLNLVGGSICCRIDKENSRPQLSKQRTCVLPSANVTSVLLAMHKLQNICPSSHVEHFDGIHSLS